MCATRTFGPVLCSNLRRVQLTGLRGAVRDCGGPGISDAIIAENAQMEKDRDGCPKIVNLGSSKTDLFYERKRRGFKKR